MASEKWTSGPWVSQGWVPTWAYIPVRDAHHNVIASMYPDAAHNYTRDEVEANAHLIAAAPDLYAALQLLLDDVADYPAWERPCRAVDVARAALSRARQT